MLTNTFTQAAPSTSRFSDARRLFLPFFKLNNSKAATDYSRFVKEDSSAADIDQKGPKVSISLTHILV